LNRYTVLQLKQVLLIALEPNTWFYNIVHHPLRFLNFSMCTTHAKCTLRARSSFQCALHTVLPQRAATAATIRTELWLRRFGKRVDTPASLQQLSSPLPQSNTINLSQRQASLTGFIKFFMDQAQLKISFICDLLQGRAQKAASVAPPHLVPLITAIHRFLLLGLGPGSFKFLSWSMREVF
jgi:hypothetical protein